MPKATIHVVDRWPQYRRNIEDAVSVSLRKAGAEISREARGVSTRYRIHGILRSIKASDIRRTNRGWEIRAGATDFREVFFEKGTYKNRRSKLSQPGRRRAGSASRGGIKAGHFLRKGLSGAFPDLERHLARELGSIRGLLR